MNKKAPSSARPRMVRVQAAVKETPSVRSIFFRDKACSQAEPGQFIMVWIPGVDEVPMSLSKIGKIGGGETSGIAVKKIGDATEALHRLKKGSLIGVRGPYGVGFKPVKGKSMVVGGGVGIASLLPLVETLKRRGCIMTVVLGAATKGELLYAARIAHVLRGEENKIITVTEDGSQGVRGLASEVVEHLLKKEKFKQVYACGPEAMLKKVLDATLRHRTSAQLSLVRYIKCGVGLCGSCMVGEYRVCTDGPVFSGAALTGVEEFGRTVRDPSGRLAPLQP